MHPPGPVGTLLVRRRIGVLVHFPGVELYRGRRTAVLEDAATRKRTRSCSISNRVASTEIATVVAPVIAKAARNVGTVMLRLDLAPLRSTS